MHLDRRVSSIGIFFGATLLLIFYLLAQRYLVDFPTPVFYIAIALMVFSLISQVLFSDLTRGFSAVVLFEIIIASLVFHYIYQIPKYGLYGSDGYFDLASLKAILKSGHLGGISELVQITSFFPLIHIIGAGLALITGIDSLAIAKWVPSIISTITIQMIYLLTLQLFKQEKAGLLAALLFASMQHFIMFGSLFVRETIAVVFAVSSVYFYVAARSSPHPVAYRGLSIVCMASTVIAHHLTSVMLLLLLALYWIFTALPQVLAIRQEFAGERVSLSFFMIGVIGTLTYWLTTVVEPVQISKFFLQNVFTPSVWGLRTILQQDTLGLVSLPNLRYIILIYGSYLCYFIFSIILIYKSLSRQNKYLETPVFTTYLVICGIIGFMSFYLLPATVGGDRFLAFGWLFAFGPLALAIVEFRSQLVSALSIFFVAFFIFLNLYTIHPTVWDAQAPGAGSAATRQDFALAQTVDFSRGEVIGYINNITTIYEAQNKEGTDAYFLLDPVDFNRFEWVIINRDGLQEEGLYSADSEEAIEKMVSLEADAGTAYNRVYESNNLLVLKQK